MTVKGPHAHKVIVPFTGKEVIVRRKERSKVKVNVSVKIMTQQEIESRAESAKQLFKQGLNCAQAVVGACCDLYGVPRDEAVRMAAGFGGGMGRMRLTCGAACGMFMLAGLHNGTAEPANQAAKQGNYQLVRTLADHYIATFGSMTCAELLGLTPTEATVKHLPCADMVAQATRIFLTETQTEH